MPSKRTIELKLQELASHPKPKVILEQYTIPAETAAELLFLAGIVHDDIRSKPVADLGCGTGRLAIGAKLLGADRVVGVEIDPDTLRVASQNAKRARVSVEWLLGDITALRGMFDTVVMNPPFGTKLKHNDKRFLTHAMQIAKVVYSIHKKSTREHMVRFIRDAGGRLEGVHKTTLQMPRTYPFHRKKAHRVDVDLYRIDTRRND